MTNGTHSTAASKNYCENYSKKRLNEPHTPGVELHGDLHGGYKIKLRKHGYRLVSSVEEDVLIVLVLAIDKREDMAAYHSALGRLISGQ